ncbi:MAG: Spy/CpxP family protein refolding chaperone [bacterium]
MSLKKNLPGIAGIILTFGMAAFAQQTQTPTTTPDGTPKHERLERREKHRERLDGMRGHDREGFGRGGRDNLFQELNLSDAQREQIHAITRRRLESTKAQREELFKLRDKRMAGTFSADDEARAKALRQEIRAAMEGVRTETAGVLTAEQKARLQDLQKERKAKHEERMKERQELRNKPQ